ADDALVVQLGEVLRGDAGEDGFADAAIAVDDDAGPPVVALEQILEDPLDLPALPVAVGKELGIDGGRPQPRRADGGAHGGRMPASPGMSIISPAGRTRRTSGAPQVPFGGGGG